MQINQPPKSTILQNDEFHPNDLYPIAYVKAVKIALQYNGKKYDEFLKLLKAVRARSSTPETYDELLNCVKGRVKNLFKGNAKLIIGFNIFLPITHRFDISLLKRDQLQTIGTKVEKVEENCELPWDVLDIISKTLDFDDLFQFARVCKNWRTFHKIYWRNFLASKEPLLLKLSCHLENLYRFIRLSDQKVYCLKTLKYFRSFRYIMFSSGYFIVTKYNNSFMLINPFTRIKKVINPPPFAVTSYGSIKCALLAFGKCSEEFVLVVLCKLHLNVYQSRNCGWVTYSSMENSGRFGDAVVLHNIIYVVTDKANIGVLNLNSTNIKFLNLKSTPNVRFPLYLNLVNCDEQLLVIHFMINGIKNVYKIDFSTMNYVKMETLGDIALFCTLNAFGFKSKSYALSNPNKWGYERNSVYVVDSLSTKCSVYSGDDKKLQKHITLPGRHEGLSLTTEWCFRHLRYEVDYSLVE